MSVYTFINGVKTIFANGKNNVTLTVNPTTPGATVTFNTAGTVSGNSITVMEGTNVQFTLTASGHDTRVMSQSMGKTNLTITPNMHITVVSPKIYYSSGASYQVSSWVSRGQGIRPGYYEVVRGGGQYVNTWIVQTNNRGEITSFSASGTITMSSSGGPISIAPTNGWIDGNYWE